MASKNISITNDVYEDLLKLKQMDESFSDIIRRLMDGTKKNPLAHFGILKDESQENQTIFDDAIKKSRDFETKNIRNRQKQLWEEI